MTVPDDPQTTPAAPTETELTLLKRFWRDGELSAREVHRRVADDLNWSVSTTRTVLERMRAKGLLKRRTVHGMAVYGAAQPKMTVIGGLIRRLTGLLEMDGPLPAAAFSGSQILDEEDIAALEALLEGGEEGGEG